jgi:hypothetical protein
VRIDYADAWSSFGSHSLCDKQASWLNGLQINAGGLKRQSLHPNENGQSKGYAPAFRTALGYERQTECFDSRVITRLR